jgi:hypothetical protein
MSRASGRLARAPRWLRSWFVFAPVLVVSPWWRCSWLVSPRQDSALVGVAAKPSLVPVRSLEPKSELPPRRETLDDRQPPVAPITLPDEVVIRAMERVQPTIAWCFKRAAKVDPTMSFKVRMKLDIDPTGVVTRGETDAEDEALGACLVRTGRSVRFPAPNRPAVVDFPLVYRL